MATFSPGPKSRREPVWVGDLVSEALPAGLQRRVLGMELLREAWREAAPDDLLLDFEPVSFGRSVLTVRAPDRVRADRARKESRPLAASLLRAAGLPGATLRIRFVVEA